jgi:hypothetical protein
MYYMKSQKKGHRTEASNPTSPIESSVQILRNNRCHIANQSTKIVHKNRQVIDKRNLNKEDNGVTW